MRDHFAVGETRYRWSTQDTFPNDGLPYMGRIGDAGELFVATGFGGWGMSNGTLAALVLSDAVQGESNEWSQLYDPERRSLAAGAKSFVTENLAVAPHQVDGMVAGAALASPGELEAGEGAIVHVGDADYAVSRQADGTLLAVSPTCTHMGCTVTWNDAESSWDCPCHGSRFAPDGRVLHGPALHPLEPANRDAAVKAY
jgi:Rieske Fe-S protein